MTELRAATRSRKHLHTLVCAAFMLLVSPLLAQSAQREVPVASLIYDLKNPDPVRRREAARALGQNKVRSGVSGLVDASKDEDETVRLEVVRALAAINDPQALTAYTALAADGNTEIRERAIAAIVNLYAAEEGGLIRKTRKVIEALNPFDAAYDNLVVEPYTAVAPEAISALAELVVDPEARIRRRAAQAVGVLRAEEAVPRLEEQLEQERDDGVKVQIIRAIYKIGQPQYGEAVLPFIEDESKAVHDEAIRTVGFLKLPEALDTLTRLYNSGPEERRRVFKVIPASGKDDLQFKLLDALAYIGSPPSESIFVRELRHRDAEFRRAAAEGLARMARSEETDRPSGSDFKDMLVEQKRSESRPEVVLALNYALYSWGEQMLLAELINGLDSPRYDQALQYLLELPSDETSRLLPFAHLNRKKVQVGLLEVFGINGGPDARPLLIELAASKEQEVASAANQAMRRINARLH